MRGDITLEQFSGPLDVLLHLIEEQEMDISTVSLSKVTEQYVAYMEQLEEVNADDIADFLVIGAKLVLQKARALLPQFLPEEDEGPDLADQLRQYQRFVVVSKRVSEYWERPQHSAIRQEPIRQQKEFVPPKSVTKKQLRQVMERLLERLSPLKPLPKTHIDARITLKQRIADLKSVLQKSRHASFSSLMQDKGNRTELIINFLALLELSKQQYVYATQDARFGDITITKV